MTPSFPTRRSSDLLWNECRSRNGPIGDSRKRLQRSEILWMPSHRLSQAPDRGLLGSPPSRDTEYIAMDCTNHRHASAGPGRSGTAPRPTLHLLPHAHRMVSAFALFVLATMSAVLPRSEEHTSELQSLMRISYAVFCLKKNTQART